MNLKTLSRFCVIGLLMWTQACATNPLNQFTEKPYFTAPQAQMTREDREIFDRALFRQENNRIQAAIKVWKQFLQKHPRSFEAHNNLGLVYFEDDQVDASIGEFETALSMEPNDSKIKKNLVRVLKFKATLLNEARGYNGAVDTLKRAQEISSPEQQEKIGFVIEKFEDKVFEQAKQTNTLAAYEGFLKRFPNSGAKADEARTKIAGLQPVSRLVDETALDDTEIPESDYVLESAVAQNDNGDMAGDGSTMKDDAGSVLKPAEQAVASSLLDSLDEGTVPEQPKEAVRSIERPIEIATQPEPKPSSGTSLVPAQEPEVVNLFDSLEEKSSSSQKTVEIVTSKDPLRVRAEPSSKSRVLGAVAKGSKVPFVTEKNGWYKIEFSAGQMGWVSKKFSRLME